MVVFKSFSLCIWSTHEYPLYLISSLVLQFLADKQADCLPLSSSGDKNQYLSNTQGHLDLQDPRDQQLLNNQNYGGGGGRHHVPNIILTGGFI